MASVEKGLEIPADVLKDLEDVCRKAMTGGTLDPERLRRIEERGDAARREVFETHGVLDIAVDLIRQSRDEG